MYSGSKNTMVGSKTSLKQNAPIMGRGFYAYSTGIGKIIVEIVTNEK
jgi:hypothetical protein